MAHVVWGLIEVAGVSNYVDDAPLRGGRLGISIISSRESHELTLDSAARICCFSVEGLN